jgi:hypothetical protein
MMQIGDAKLNRPVVGYWRKLTPVTIADPYYVALPANGNATDILTKTVTLDEVSDIMAVVSGQTYCDLAGAGKITWGINFLMDGTAPADQLIITLDQDGSAAGDWRMNFSLCYQWSDLAAGAHTLKFQALESAQTARTRRIYRACLITEVCKS